MAIMTNKSLQNVGGTPCVVWNGMELHRRKPSRDEFGFIEEESDIPLHAGTRDLAPEAGLEGYLRLPNIMVVERKAPQELMLCCESFDRPIVRPWTTGIGIYELGIDVSDSVKTDDLLDALGVSDRKRAARERAGEAIKMWCYPADVDSAIPVRDLVAMSADLKALITMLVYSLGGACSREMLTRNVPPTLAMFNPESGCYYAHVKGLPPWLMHGDVGNVAQYYEATIFPLIAAEPIIDSESARAKDTMFLFCRDIVTAFMSQLYPTLERDGFYAGGEIASLGGAYAFWAREAMRGKAAVCERCGRLFVRKRRTGRFCGGACREYANSRNRR